MPADEWGLPDTTSKFSITHYSSNFFVVEENQVDFATVYNDGATSDQSGTLTATTLTGLGMGALSKPVYDLALTCTVITMALSPLVSSAALPLGRAWRARSRFGCPEGCAGT